MPRDTVSVAECDYLEEDAEIRGQRYACLSFVSPEKILDNKNVFTFTKFTEQFCSDVNELFSNMKEKYPEDADGFQAIGTISDIVDPFGQIHKIMEHHGNNKTSRPRKPYRVFKGVDKKQLWPKCGYCRS